MISYELLLVAIGRIKEIVSDLIGSLEQSLTKKVNDVKATAESKVDEAPAVEGKTYVRDGKAKQWVEAPASEAGTTKTAEELIADINKIFGIEQAADTNANAE